ncbi:MAG: alpha/beta fold hydrolase [Sedimentitalea sp.]
MYASINGATLYFDVDGVGLAPDGPEMRERPTVVLVHGGPGADHTVYKPSFSALRDVAQVIYYDHRGNGRSSFCTPETWTLAQWSDDLRGLCDHLGVVSPIVIGASFGGFVAQAYAARHPGHAGKIALLSTAAKVAFPEIYKAFARRGGPDIAAVAQAYWENPTDDSRAQYRDRCVPYYALQPSDNTDWLSRIKMRNETALHFNGPKGEQGKMDFRQDLTRLNCPTLVIGGRQDPIMPIAFSRTIAQHVPEALLEYHELDNCAHMIMRDQPDKTMSLLKAFIVS